MPELEVTQTANQVSGHQAGRDVNVITQLPRPTPIANLLAQFREELKRNSEFRQMIDALKHYSDPTDGNVIGLEEKLKLASRSDQVISAKRLKEAFSKKLHQFQFFESAQEIFAYLLGRIEINFEHKVKPLILEQRSRTEIDAAVADLVITPILEEIFAQENDLKIFAIEVRGMLYFLTGNCHIEWHKSC